jgi:hypothetical protein
VPSEPAAIQEPAPESDEYVLVDDAIQAETMRVAILTPLGRPSLLPLILDGFLRQTWAKSLRHWVVADGSYVRGAAWDATLARIDAELRVRGLDMVVVDAGAPKEPTIGSLRNALNDAFQGTDSDWAVCWDDDDLYPRTRVEAAIRMMLKESKAVAGCTCHYIVDPDLGDLTFQFRIFGAGHATNNTMAYHKTFLKDRRYDDQAAQTEEQAFLGTPQGPPHMCQIPPQYAVLQIAHPSNTCAKRDMLLSAIASKYIDALSESHASCHLTHLSPHRAIGIPRADYDRMVACLQPVPPKVPDVVWYAGFHLHIPGWSPRSTSLGGAEQAIVLLSESWARKGVTVAVYGNVYEDPDAIPDGKTHASQMEARRVRPSFEHHGVWYHSAQTFRISTRYKNLILWRDHGVVPLTFQKRLCAERLILDLHDTYTSDVLQSTFCHAIAIPDIVVFKSAFHRRIMEERGAMCVPNPTHLWHRTMVIPNGLRDCFDPVRSLADRSPFRLLYCSCYKRGLIPLLQWFFPTLRALDQRYTLDIMYGMEHIDPSLADMVTRLLKQPGVTDHGRLSWDQVRDLKYQCGFHLYYTRTNAEIDCISVRESARCGCIPIVRDGGVFAERPGLRLKGDPTYEEDHKRAAIDFHTMVKDHTVDLQGLREKMVHHQTTMGWDQIADQWLDTVLIATADGSPPTLDFDYRTVETHYEHWKRTVEVGL